MSKPDEIADSQMIAGILCTLLFAGLALLGGCATQTGTRCYGEEDCPTGWVCTQAGKCERAEAPTRSRANSPR